MKAPASPDTSIHSQAAANQPATGGVALPAVVPAGFIQEEAPLKGELMEPLLLDMDDDGEDEGHTLILDTADGQLWIHSDKETLQLFLERKRTRHAAHMTPAITELLNKIETLAKKIHVNIYGATIAANRVSKTTGKIKTSKHVAATKQQRAEAITQLGQVAILLQKLNALSGNVMKKVRPPSNKESSSVHTVDGDAFCKQIIMQPLSILPRRDGIVGSSPSDESKLFTALNRRVKYIRGHMLNDHLHGPGTNDNMVPISTAFNSVMKTTVEAKTKDAVNSNNKVVRFEAESLDWGAYKGYYNGGFPDENKLPAKFRFLVKQMVRIPGKDGSDISHWKLAAKSPIFNETLPHTLPTATGPVKGTIAPVTETFIPGYYSSLTGDLKEVPPDYHLSGMYIINGPSFDYLFLPLGLDKTSLVSKEYNLEVTTRFSMPPGYELIKIPAQKIEFIHEDKILTTDTRDGQSFVIAKKTERDANLLAYAEKIKEVKKAAEDKKLVKAPPTNAPARYEVKSLAELKQAKRLRELEPAFKTEMTRYLPELNPEYAKRFTDIEEKTLAKTKADWEKDLSIGNLEIAALLAPLFEQMAKDKNILLNEQLAKNKDSFAKGLINELMNTINSRYRPQLKEEWRKNIFDKEAEGIFNLHKKFWTDPNRLFDVSKRDELLQSAYTKLDGALDKAKKAEPHKRKPDTELKKEVEEDKKPKTDRGPFVPVTTNVTNAPQPDIPRFQPLSPPVSTSSSSSLVVADRENAGTLKVMITSIAHSHPAQQNPLNMLLENIERFIHETTPQNWTNVDTLLQKCTSITELGPYLPGWIAEWRAMNMSH